MRHRKPTGRLGVEALQGPVGRLEAGHRGSICEGDTSIVSELMLEQKLPVYILLQTNKSPDQSNNHVFS